MTEPKLPASLFKYQPISSRALENLKSRSIWFGPAIDFNDPFDCAIQVAPQQLTQAQVLDLLKHYRTQGTAFAEGLEDLVGHDLAAADHVGSKLAEAVRTGMQTRIAANIRERGIACFSESPSEILMWAHYADGHRGMCLEFDTAFKPFNQARAVRYEDETPQLDPVAVVRGDIAGRDVVDVMFLTKFRTWQYEREWRVLHKTARTSYTYEWKALKSVYLGAAMPNTMRDVVCQLLHGSPTKIFLMERSERGFAVVAKEVVYTPFKYLPDAG